MYSWWMILLSCLVMYVLRLLLVLLRDSSWIRGVVRRETGGGGSTHGSYVVYCAHDTRDPQHGMDSWYGITY